MPAGLALKITGYRVAVTAPEIPPITAPVVHEPVTAKISTITIAVMTATNAMKAAINGSDGERVGISHRRPESENLFAW